MYGWVSDCTLLPMCVCDYDVCFSFVSSLLHCLCLTVMIISLYGSIC